MLPGRQKSEKFGKKTRVNVKEEATHFENDRRSSVSIEWFAMFDGTYSCCDGSEKEKWESRNSVV